MSVPPENLPLVVLLLFYVPEGADYTPSEALLAGVFRNHEGISLFVNHRLMRKRKGTWIAREVIVVP